MNNEFDYRINSFNDDEIEHILKVVFIGTTGVGKTNLMNVFNNGNFNINSKTTIGVDFALKPVRISNRLVKVQLWDTAGQERYRSFTQAYFKDSNGMILVYDVTRKSSFDELTQWLEIAYKQTSKDKCNFILVGNKIDLENQRQVSQEQGKEFARQNGLLFMETSALDNRNDCVGQAFYILLNEILKQFPQPQENGQFSQEEQRTNQQRLSSVLNNNDQKKGCC